MATINAFEMVLSTFSLVSWDCFMSPMSEIRLMFDPSLAIDRNLVDVYSLTMNIVNFVSLVCL